MPFTISAIVNTTLPGSVQVNVTGDPAVQSTIVRVDGSLPEQPVRNWSDTGSGIEFVIDCEAPLGRPVFYKLLSYFGDVLATSETVTCPEDPEGRSILRSVLKPHTAWMWCEPQTETGVRWSTSTRSYEVIGSDTPVVVGELRQRHTGTLAFFCKTPTEVDQMVSILRDGLPMLVRHSPCANRSTRDMLFYALDVEESLFRNGPWRTVAVDYQTTKFVVGDTEEPPSSWTFEALAATGEDFAEQSLMFATFQDMALNRRRPILVRQP